MKKLTKVIARALLPVMTLGAAALDGKTAAGAETAAPAAGTAGKGIASEYVWDGAAADGSGRLMKDDPRVILFDDFSDYNADLSEHVKSGSDKTPKRWIGDMDRGLTLDFNEKFSGAAGMRNDIPEQDTAYGGTIGQWVDLRALNGEPMNNEQMTAKAYNVADIPAGGMPVEPGVKPKEGGFTELYGRAMIKYADGFDRYGHNGIHFSGGYFCRPNPGAGGGADNPGSTAGYRSNGFDRFDLGLEPEQSGYITSTRPGTLNVYYYGAEQLGASGNHMFPNGIVYGSTGGDSNLSLMRKDGVNGFVKLPPYAPPVGEWFCMEFYVKLNTVIKNGISPGPNEMPVWSPTSGPQPLPEGCEILHDGVLKAWVNGKLVMDYNDVVVRYTDTMVIDLVQFSSYFGTNTSPGTSIWWDNIVVATDYIGPVNTGSVAQTEPSPAEPAQTAQTDMTEPAPAPAVQTEPTPAKQTGAVSDEPVVKAIIYGIAAAAVALGIFAFTRKSRKKRDK